MHGAHHVIKIRQRLAHAHHHHIADNARLIFVHALVRAVVGAEALVGQPQLADDFGDTQIAVKALPPGSAERTFERAARLRRYAQRAARDFRNKHGFDGIACADIDQPFARSVAGDGVAHNRGAADRRLCSEAFAQHFGDVGHDAEVGGARPVNPVQQLLGAKGFFTQLRAIRGEFWPS